MMSTIYSNYIIDIKRSGLDGKCNKCVYRQRSLIRITFNRRVGWEDKYLCDILSEHALRHVKSHTYDARIQSILDIAGLD